MLIFSIPSRGLAYAVALVTAFVSTAVVAQPTGSVAATSATGQYDADGNEAVRTALIAWTLGQHPELAASPQLQMASRQIEGLPGTAVRPKMAVAGAEVEAYLQAVSDAARTMPLPEKIRIEIPANLRNAQANIRGLRASGKGGLVLSSQTDDIGGTPALLRVYLQWPGFGNAMAEWVLEKPFYLPLPEDLGLPEVERGNAVRNRTLLSIVLDMTDPVANIRGQVFAGVSAKARIESVDLIHRIERRSEGNFVADPDRVLASWTHQDSAPAAPESLAPVDLSELVALFGGAINADRYLPANNIYSTGGSAAESRGLIAGAQTKSIETALAFGAILNAGGQRTIGPESAQIALRQIVSEREKYELFPVSYLTDHGSMNELQRSSALAEAEPGLRALIAARMPELPLKVRSVMVAQMGDYDATLEGFPLFTGSGIQYLWMPGASRDEIAELIPDFLPLSLDEAGQLLASVERRNERSRPLFIAVDYTLTEVRVRPGRNGPIQPAELRLVRYTSQIDRVTIFADPDLSVPVSVQEHEAMTAEAPTPLPDAIFATTGKSLMGAVGRQPGGRDIVLQAAGYMRDIQRAAPGQRERMAEIVTEDIISAGMDEFWVGIQMQLGAFDARESGFPVKSLHFRPVVHGEDISGVEAPALEVYPARDIEVLRVDSDQRSLLESYLDLARAGAVDGMHLRGYARVLPISAEPNRGEPILKISAPSELLLGAVEKGGRQWPSTDGNRILIAPPEELGPASGKIPEVVPPEALLLDHEGIDLLAISLAPETYDSSAYERMLLERLLKEHSFAQNPENAEQSVAMSWGNFFNNPSLSLTKRDITELVADFRTWTLARSKALPNVLLLPIGGQPHPLSDCRGLTVLTQPQIDMNDPFLNANTPALLGPEMVLNERRHNLYGSGRPSEGSDNVFYWNGGGRYGGSQSCNYVTKGLPSMIRGIQAENATFVSAIITVKDQPIIGPVSEIPGSYLYRLSVDQLRFVPAAELDSPPEKLGGFVALTANVEAAEAYRQDQFGAGYKTVGKIVKGDWDDPSVIAPVAQDVVGLTPGMPLNDFIAAVRKRMPNAVLFEPKAIEDGIFGAAVGLLNPETDEAILGIYSAGIEAQPVVAIMRHLKLSRDSNSTAAVRAALLDKYGTTPSQEAEDHMIWGGLSQEEDSWGFCGGMSWIGRYASEAPRLYTSEQGQFEDASRIPPPRFWSGFGWPIDLAGDSASRLQDPKRCGPVVASSIYEADQDLRLVVWLFDRNLAEQQRSAPALEVEASNVGL